MTDEELRQIEARAKTAQPGPWRIKWHTSRPDLQDGLVGADGYAVLRTDSGIYPPDMPTLEFIAAAREDIPRLVAEVRRLQRDHYDRCPCCDAALSSPTPK